MNRTQTALKIREQFDGFMGIVSPHFSKPQHKFLNQIVFGLQSAKDIKLSNVVRALDEPIKLKKTEERLSRNLATQGMDEKLNALIAAQGASRIGRDTLIIVDPTDIHKEYAENHQVLDVMRTIHEAARGRDIFVYARGGDRKTIMHELLDQGSRMIIRQVGNRHLIFNGKPREELDVAEGCAMKL